MPTYYFDGSDAAASDPNAVWTDVTNADDGSITTSATTITSGSSSSNYTIIEGTNAPSSGLDIESVSVRMYGNASGGVNPNLVGDVYTNGLAETITPSNFSKGTYGSYVTLTEPSSGWTYPTLQSLECKIWMTKDSGVVIGTIYRVEILVYLAHYPANLYKHVSVGNGMSRSDSAT